VSERRLRVAIFSGNYNYIREGANQALNQLVAYLERAGHEVRVYSPVTDTPAFEPQGTLVPVPSIALPVRTEFRLALGIPKPIRADVERFAPDLIHVSTPDILCTRAETLAKRMRVPIVASMHTRFETYFDYYGLGWLRPVAEAHLRRFYRRADCVLAPTPGVLDEMKRLRGDNRVSLWSRGVDRSLFNPGRRDADWRRRHGWTADDVVVLWLGRLVLEKGVDIFVEVISRLHAAGQNVRPLIVGAGPAEDRMCALDGAIFTGHLQGIDLARAIASADLMVNPSTTEAFGNVVLEAMASGLAVISAGAPSARALIDDGKTGVLCTPQDPAAYVRAAIQLIDNPAERQRIGAAAAAASAAYSWDAASRAAEQAYFKTLADHPLSPLGSARLAPSEQRMP
jgi:glycosyltransferase involved in cell wall biosynthesis